MENNPHNPLPPEQLNSLVDLLRLRAEFTPDAPAYREFSPSQGWHSYRWAELAADVARWQSALQAMALNPGDRVAIMLRNCVDWVRFDQAALGLGLVVVPLYMQDRPENSAYVLNNSGARLLFLESAEQWQMIAATGHLREQLQQVVIQNGDSVGSETDHPRITPLSDWLDQPAGALQCQVTDPDTLATIQYTSGTTGRPKGVMLSHGNILSNIIAVDRLVSLYSNDLLLSFLPLSHGLERTAGYYVPIYTGSEVAFSRGTSFLTEDLQQVRPTVLISVPRIFERVDNAIRDKLAGKPALLARLFEYTVGLGWREFEYQQGLAGRPAGRWLLTPLLKLFARPVLKALGGRLRFAVCGGAPLAAGVARTFTALGLPLLQGYGLTETSPIISGNPPEANRPHSVGRIIPGVEVMIGESDEILCRGPNVMLGYWNNPQATEAAVDSQGWFHTGDCGRLEDDRLFITGRLKEIIVLANGEKVPPSGMEQAIDRDPLIEQSMVIGEGKPYLAALVVVSTEELARLNRQRDQPFTITGEALNQEILRRVTHAIAEFPGYAKIYRVACSDEPWEVDNGLVTPTLKIKRAAVESRFANQIQDLYAGH
ncbi:MAG: long-chain fatty acid--CoA ligase [Gammaproteobacteria bacterium]